MTTTFIVISILALLILFGLKPKKNFLLDIPVTENLKAFSALVVIFSHVGYFLFSDHSIMAPFSNYGGVAVNLFFFLSAYGLSLSAEKWKGNLKGYFKKRVLRIAPSIWLAIILFFIADFFVHGIFYGWGYMVKSFFLIYPSADLYTDIDSPLWYITPLVIYYMLFPFLNMRGRSWLSAGIFLVLGIIMFHMPFIGPLYTLHYLAFPLGILWARYSESVALFLGRRPRWTVTLFSILCAVFFLVTGIYSGVGTPYEQYMSNLTMLSLIGFLITIPFTSATTLFIGSFSFEFYLLHWPLMYRYDFLYSLRAWPAVWLLSWLVCLIGIGWVFKKTVHFLEHKTFLQT
jgi:peptidoglycan/LPS O-acetylase OafA/YrhL